MAHRTGRRRFIATAAAGLTGPAGLLATPAVLAQSTGGYPSRPIQLVVPLGAGGVADVSARIVARRLSSVLGVPVVIENRPGGSQAVGIRHVARAAPDGYTLLWSTGGFAAAPVLVRGFEFDPIRDFQPITMATTSNNVVVGTMLLPISSFQDLVEYSKQNPGRVFYGTASGGTTLIFEHLKMLTGAQMEPVSYRGSPEAWADIVAGRLQVYLDGPMLAKPFIDAGQARALGTLGPRRSDVFPNVPTIAEQGLPNFSILTWYGLWAPKATPEAAVLRLEQAMAVTMATPDTQQELARAGLDASIMTSAEFTEAIRTELALWRMVSERAGIRPQ